MFLRITEAEKIEMWKQKASNYYKRKPRTVTQAFLLPAFIMFLSFAVSEYDIKTLYFLLPSLFLYVIVMKRIEAFLRQAQKHERTNDALNLLLINIDDLGYLSLTCFTIYEMEMINLVKLIEGGLTIKIIVFTLIVTIFIALAFSRLALKLRTQKII